jgi:hypothetical protein
VPSIEFDGWREEGKIYSQPPAKYYYVEVSWTVRNDLNTAIFLCPRVTGFGVDTGYMQGHVVNPGQTYSGACGHEFTWVEGAEDDVTVEYVYSLSYWNPPYYELGSATHHVVMPPYPAETPPGSPPPPTPPPKHPIIGRIIDWWRQRPKMTEVGEVREWAKRRPKVVALFVARLRKGRVKR